MREAQVCLLQMEVKGTHFLLPFGERVRERRGKDREGRERGNDYGLTTNKCSSIAPVLGTLTSLGCSRRFIGDGVMLIV
jgi:hypothetical protein